MYRVGQVRFSVSNVVNTVSKLLLIGHVLYIQRENVQLIECHLVHAGSVRLVEWHLVLFPFFKIFNVEWTINCLPTHTCALVYPSIL